MRPTQPDVQTRSQDLTPGDVEIDLRGNGVAGVEQWVTVAEASNGAGINRATIRRWYRSGRVPTQRAGGDHGAFLVPLTTILRLADEADAAGDDLGDPVVDVNANYWSFETAAAREEAAVAREEAEAAREELAAAQADALTAATARKDAELARAEAEAARTEAAAAREVAAIAQKEAAAAREDAAAADEEADAADEELAEVRRQLTFLRDQLAEAIAAERAATDRADDLDCELGRLREITAATSSITDTSWLNVANRYESPVRGQGMQAAQALRDGFEPVSGADIAVGDIALADHPLTDVDETEAPRPAPRPKVHRRWFGHQADDLLPVDDKKNWRGRL